MGVVLDYSGRAPTDGYPADCVGVIRYIAPRLASGARRSKCITPAELAMHHAADRAVGFVFEAGANNSLGGDAQGDRDGRVAITEMQTLGVPRGVACYAAVDRDITAAQLPTVASYLDAFHLHTTAAGFRRGVYGEYDVVVSMLRDRHVDLGWQTVAWSTRRKAFGVPGVALYQRAGQIVVDGTTCDVNEVWASDWGQWAPNYTTAAAPSVSTEDLLMSAARDDDDARRTLIRWWFHQFLGRNFKGGTYPNGQKYSAVDELNLHVYIAATKGLDVALAGIVDSNEALEYAAKRAA